MNIRLFIEEQFILQNSATSIQNLGRGESLRLKCSWKSLTFEVQTKVNNFLELQPNTRDTQRIVSVNYLFGRPLIPSDFLKKIVTLNFRDMRNLISVVFRLLKMLFWVLKNGQLSFSEGDKRGMDKYVLLNSRILTFP